MTFAYPDVTFCMAFMYYGGAGSDGFREGLEVPQTSRMGFSERLCTYIPEFPKVDSQNDGLPSLEKLVVI